METVPIPNLNPALRKSKPSYTGALGPTGRSRTSYDDARRVRPKGTEKYDGAFRATIRVGINLHIDIEDIPNHLRTPADFTKVSTLLTAAITAGKPDQIKPRCRALIAYFERIIPTIAHPQRRAYLQHIILGLKLKGGTNAQKAEAQGWLA